MRYSNQHWRAHCCANKHEIICIPMTKCAFLFYFFDEQLGLGGDKKFCVSLASRDSQYHLLALNSWAGTYVHSHMKRSTSATTVTLKSKFTAAIDLRSIRGEYKLHVFLDITGLTPLFTTSNCC